MSSTLGGRVSIYVSSKVKWSCGSWFLDPTRRKFSIRVGRESGRGSSVRSLCTGIPRVALLHPTSMDRVILRLRLIDSDGSLDGIDLVRGSPSGPQRDHFTPNRWGFDISSGPIEIFLGKGNLDRPTVRETTGTQGSRCRKELYLHAENKRGRNGSRASHRRP